MPNLSNGGNRKLKVSTRNGALMRLWKKLFGHHRIPLGLLTSVGLSPPVEYPVTVDPLQCQPAKACRNGHAVTAIRPKIGSGF
jgi:hypothetical protein